MSNHIIFPDLEAITLPTGKRVYTTPEGNHYPSITTILSSTGDKTGLEAWKKRVGKEKAAKIVKEATENGSAMHDILEAHCLGLPYDASNQVAMQMAKFGIKSLDKNLTHVVQTEACLYSDRLRIAGRTDMVCFWKDKLCVLDYKNRGTKEFKKESHCLTHKLQICFYSQAIEERISRFPKVGVILQLNTFGCNVIEFDPLSKELKYELSKRIEEYYNQEK